MITPTETLFPEPAPLTLSALRLCTCTPGHRCRPCSERVWACLRLMRVVPNVQRLTDPVAWADGQTSGADARTAINLARGVPADRIHPARGTA